MRKIRSISESMEILSRRIPAVLREDGSINKTKLAKLAGLNQSTLHRIMDEGKYFNISFNSRHMLIKLFQCTIEQLEGTEPIPEVDTELFEGPYLLKTVDSISIPIIYLSQLSLCDSVLALDRLRFTTKDYFPVPLTIGLSDSAFMVVIDKKFESQQFLIDDKVMVDTTHKIDIGKPALIHLEKNFVGSYRAARCETGFRFIPESNLFEEIKMQKLAWPFIGVCKAIFKELK